MSEKEHPTTSPVPILLGAIGVLVVVLVLVALLFPLILENSPMGEVIYEAEVNETLDTLERVEETLLEVLNVTGATTFDDVFTPAEPFYDTTIEDTVDRHSEWAAMLLDEERRAELILADGVAEQLEEVSMQLPTDPWGRKLRVYLGPWESGRHGDIEKPPFLSYYNAELQKDVDGIPPPEDSMVIVYSVGRDGMSSQPFALRAHDTVIGDDIGSWVR